MGRIPRLHLPMRSPADVIPHLGAKHHYREGRSAQLIAETWFAAQHRTGKLPVMIQHVVDQDPRLAGAELIDAFLERSIKLRDHLRPSQADVLAILGLSEGLAIMAIEGKVDESFGPRVSEWLVDASEGKNARLRSLCATLGIEPTASLPPHSRFATSYFTERPRQSTRRSAFARESR